MSVQEESVAEETEVLEPIVEAAIEPAAEPVAEVESQPELELEVPAPAPAKPEIHDERVFRKVIAEVREEKRQERSLREAAEQRAADLQAILERMQAGDKPPEPVVKPAAAPQGTDFKAAVRAQAAIERMYEDSRAVLATGQAKFADFDDSLAKLNDVNVMNDEFVADLLAVDKEGAHVIIDKLAKDLQRATSLAGMDSRRRIAELTRMADAPKTEPKPVVEAPKPTNTISRAPAPKPAVSPLSAAPDIDPTTPEGNEKMSDRQFEKWYKDKYQKRA